MPMPLPLLARQVWLLNFLSSTQVVFGEVSGISASAKLFGIDPRMLFLEARFSYNKRMEKIAALLPKTFELLDGELARLAPAFIEMHPPISISRLENARQFCDFLQAFECGGSFF